MFSRKEYNYAVDKSTRVIIAGAVIVFFIFFVGSFIYNLAPVKGNNNNVPTVVFDVQQGESFREIAGDLAVQGLVRSRVAFEFLALFEGKAAELKPGLYQLDAGMTSEAILDALTNTANRAVTVTIPEGSNIYEIDAILANAFVIRRGDLIDFKDDGNLEGMLFPDTYQFFPGSDVKDVVQKMLANFNVKAAPVLAADGAHATNDIIIASMLEKEVPTLKDQEIVAGILQKRIAGHMSLDIDATICYVKLEKNPTSTSGCYPITVSDKQTDSPYNTYRHLGLPPAPIGNPGIQAITAAINPKQSPYWYYLSDPKTGTTIYATTLAQQVANQKKYLK